MLKSDLFPEYWKEFVNKNNLEWAEIEFPWPDEDGADGEDDLNVIVEILDDKTAEREAYELWPGIGILKDGYIPVGGCGIGSGDPFCINKNDGKNGPLYLVDHERVGLDGYDKDDAISVMLNNYEELLAYREQEEV
jgi:hypothetical protein